MDVEYIVEFLGSMGEIGMMREVQTMHNRLEAFSSGVDRDCMQVQSAVVYDSLLRMEKHAEEIKRLFSQPVVDCIAALRLYQSACIQRELDHAADTAAAALDAFDQAHAQGLHLVEQQEESHACV